MSLLKKFTSLSPLQSPATDTEKKQFDENCDGNAENLKRVDVHWQNATQIMAVDERTVSPQERCNILVGHLNGIVSVLMEERDENPGPCLQYVLHENVFHVVYAWSAGRRDCALEMKSEQLKLFRNLIEKGKAPLLIYEQVWKPLLFLLHSCVDKIPPESEETFVAVLKGLCVSVNRDIALLDLFFLDNQRNSQIAKLSVFSLLIPFVHREGNVGTFARDAMLLCMALSSVDSRLGAYIADDTCFCPVLATGLSALYSDLPTSLEIASEDWYSLERGLWAIFPELVAFLTSLEFCNNVIQIAHPKVHVQLLDLIYNGFLVSVMAPALHQSSTEALTAATAYLDLFLRSITDANLMQVFVKFILTEKFDDQPILDSLISRISQDSQLAVVSLGLFHTLLELNCEDIMYSLVLKYLIPCTHILTSQRRTLQEVDFYSRSAAKFLSLTPSCCDLYKQPSRPTSPNSSSNNSSNGSDGQVKIDMKTRSDLVFYRSPILSSLYLEVCTEYMEYLCDARVALRNCKLKCRCWSAPYNGQNPSPASTVVADRERSDSSTLVSGSLSCPNGSIPVKDSSKKARAISDVAPYKENPDLGIFINTLFQKVEKMPQNSFYVNLVLTGVITRLACYPQPLLKSFLLNYNMILKPGVRSLFQILSSVKIRVESIVSQMDGLDRLLKKAQKNLIIREEKSRASIQSAFMETNPFDPQNSQGGQRRLIRQRTDSALLSNVKPLLKDGPAPRGFDQLARRASTDSTNTTSTLSLNGSNESLASLSPQFGSVADVSSEDYVIPRPGTVQKASSFFKNFQMNQRKLVTSPKNTYKRRNPRAIKNAVYCVLVLEEWLRELAAVSQEHALTTQATDEAEVLYS